MKGEISTLAARKGGVFDEVNEPGSAKSHVPGLQDPLHWNGAPSRLEPSSTDFKMKTHH
jgi:hypothetical protein